MQKNTRLYFIKLEPLSERIIICDNCATDNKIIGKIYGIIISGSPGFGNEINGLDAIPLIGGKIPISNM
jgi:hypothetical protein